MGRIITFSGTSGSGKTAIARELLKMPRTYNVTSLTTRDPRPSDNPNDYFHLTPHDLNELENHGGLLWRRFVGNDEYATSKHSVDQALLQEGSTHLMIITPECVDLLYAYVSSRKSLTTHELISFFVLPPDPDELYRRLRLQDRNFDELASRQGDELHWETRAHNSPVPFHFVVNDGQLHDTMKVVRSFF